jgi:hypothetical protein
MLDLRDREENISARAVYDLARGDPTFPKQRKMGHRSRWLITEIEEWAKTRPAGPGRGPNQPKGKKAKKARSA